MTNRVTKPPTRRDKMGTFDRTKVFARGFGDYNLMLINTGWIKYFSTMDNFLMGKMSRFTLVFAKKFANLSILALFSIRFDIRVEQLIKISKFPNLLSYEGLCTGLCTSCVIYFNLKN